MFALGNNASEAADAKAEQLESMADNTSGVQEDELGAYADATREAGAAREEVIDDAYVNADAMTNDQKNALVNGHC